MILHGNKQWQVSFFVGKVKSASRRAKERVCLYVRLSVEPERRDVHQMCRRHLDSRVTFCSKNYKIYMIDNSEHAYL